MALMEWTDEYSVNVEEIDKQHKQLVAMLNQFYKELTADDDSSESKKRALNGLVGKMAEYTVYHFQTEETLMERSAYPSLRAHKKEHDEFVAKVTDVKDRFESGKLILTVEVTNFLKKWLREHILGVDKRLGSHLRRQGVS